MNFSLENELTSHFVASEDVLNIIKLTQPYLLLANMPLQFFMHFLISFIIQRIPPPPPRPTKDILRSQSPVPVNVTSFADKVMLG